MSAAPTVVVLVVRPSWAAALTWHDFLLMIAFMLVLEVERIQCCEECSGVRNEQDNNGNRIVPAIGNPLCTASLTPRLLRLFCACVRACVRPFFS